MFFTWFESLGKYLSISVSCSCCLNDKKVGKKTGNYS